MSSLIICDIDGVIADPIFRLPFLEQKDYGNFYKPELMRKDLAILSGMQLVEYLYFADDENELVFVTGRPERTRRSTIEWFHKHEDEVLWSDKYLFMRKNGDYRPSPIVKVELVEKVLKHYLEEHDSKPDCIYFIDDDPENVKAVCREFSDIVSITFGIERMEK